MIAVASSSLQPRPYRQPSWTDLCCSSLPSSSFRRYFQLRLRVCCRWPPSAMGQYVVLEMISPPWLVAIATAPTKPRSLSPRCRYLISSHSHLSGLFSPIPSSAASAVRHSSPSWRLSLSIAIDDLLSIPCLFHVGGWFLALFFPLLVRTSHVAPRT